jgi:parallel beta-helix repeat protein
LQASIDAAQPGNTISVFGTCGENVLIRNEKQRITIDGGGTATITAPSATSPALNVRGKGILVQGFTIAGGSDGIEVNRGSNAVLNNNVIQNTAGNGVLVDQLSFTVITNNTIENNPGAGIFVSQHSTARIGFNLDTETTVSPNTIQNNTFGVVVSNGSSARIIGNVIENNGGDGVLVTRDSHADLASDSIEGNGGDGIKLSDGAVVQLGEDSGTSIYETPNTTGSANTGFGIRCTDGGVADGRLGSLTGSSGTASFDGSCAGSLNP